LYLSFVSILSCDGQQVSAYRGGSRGRFLVLHFQKVPKSPKKFKYPDYGRFPSVFAVSLNCSEFLNI